MKINPKDYYCSKHGGNGEPSCKECWKNLLRLFNDANCNVITDEKTKRQHSDLYDLPDSAIEEAKDFFKKDG